MKSSTPSPFVPTLLRSAVVAGALAVAGASLGAQAATFEPGAVYTTTNAASGNAVAVYTRGTDGALTFDELVPTGGLGTDAGLGNQGAVVLSTDEALLFAVNAGSDDVSTFRVLENGLELLDVAPSGGSMPVSVAQRGRLVYVLNAGDDTISGLRVRHDGRLEPLPGSTRALSATGAAAAQISFSPDGRFLVVTEKATNVLSIFQVEPNDRPGHRFVVPSPGTTPFGFAFGRRGQLVLSEAAGGADGASTVSTFQLGALGLTPGLITGAVPSGETAACWVAVTPDGRLAYVSNTGSDTVSAFAIGFDGTPTLLDPAAATTGATPLDVALTADGRFFYVLNAGAGSIGDYVVEADGALTSIPGSNSGLPSSVSGLAAR